MPDRVDALTDRGHFGLIGMRERAELIGARLVIHSSPGQGTTVELILPASPLCLNLTSERGRG